MITSHRRASALAIALLTGVLYVGTCVLTIATPSSEGTGAFDLLWPTPFAAMVAVGALIATRRSGNATGWLFAASGSLMVGNAFTLAYARYSFSGPDKLPAADLVAWFSFWTWMPAVGMIGLILLVFPTGEPPFPRWRWIQRAAVVLLAVVPIAALLTLPARGPQLLDASTPGDVPGGALLNVLSNVLLPAFLPLGFVALVIRFIRSRGVERLQMKWFVFGTSFLVFAAVVPFLLNVEDPISHPLGGGSVLIGMTAIPVTAGIAILRYRLYDIDRIISRTLAYGLMSACLLGVYALSVFVLGRILRPMIGSGDIVVAAATLIVAAAFGPVRRRMQIIIDRRFNRARYDATRTIEAFSAHVREQVDSDSLAPELTEVVRRTMAPASVSLWLRAKQPPSGRLRG